MTRVKVPPPLPCYDALTPQACLETRVTPQTVYLGEVPVNLSRICIAASLDHGYVSRIFRGQRAPSMKYLRRIAAALRMSPEALGAALADVAKNPRKSR